MKKEILFIIFFQITFCSFSQIPNIKYESVLPIYKLGIDISPLTPINTGGVILPSGTTTTFAGSGRDGLRDGIGALVSFSYPTGLAIDSDNNLFVADQHNHTIRKIYPTGETTSIAGHDRGDIDGNGALARFDIPSGIVITSNGDLCVTDCYNHKIKKINSTGDVITYSGNGREGSVNGNVKLASFSYPFGMDVDIDGNLYIADSRNNQIRKISSTGEVTTLAGSIQGSNDGTAKTARFNNPWGVAVDNLGNVYVADSGNNKIRKITPQGTVTTIAGSDVDVSGSDDGIGGIARFNFPTGIYVDSSDQTIYIADRYNHKIRKINAKNIVSTISGTGVSGAVDGENNVASFHDPSGIVVDKNKNIYVADISNHKIRKIIQLSFVISPDLPVGLSFDEATGIISGAPLVATPLTTYTITAYNSFGKNSTEVSFATSKNLSVNDLIKDVDDLMIYSKNDVLVIDAQNFKINSVKVYDVNGRVLFERKDLNVSVLSVDNLCLKNQPLVIQLTNFDNQTINKKFIY